MAATPYRAVSWAPLELIGEDKMDQMSSNIDYLRDNSLRGNYVFLNGGKRAEGLRIAGGKVLIPRNPKSDSASGPVRFGGFFSSGCKPIITTGIVADFNRRIFVAINGYGTLEPDHRGFQVFVNVAAENKKNDKIAGRMFVHWQALGY